MPRNADLIQNPELLRRLSQEMGLRQAHTSPTLAPTVQPVVLVSDLTKQERRGGISQLSSGIVRTVANAGTSLNPTAVVDQAIVYYNYPKPAGGGGAEYAARLRFLEIYNGSAANLLGLQIGWRDTSSAPASNANSSDLDSFQNKNHVGEFFQSNIDTQGGLGWFLLSPAAGTTVAGNALYTRRSTAQALYAQQYLRFSGNELPVVIRPGTGLVVQAFNGGVAILAPEVNAIFDIESLS